MTPDYAHSSAIGNLSERCKSAHVLTDEITRRVKSEHQCEVDLVERTKEQDYGVQRSAGS